MAAAADWLAASIAVAAISATIARGSIFDGFRAWLRQWPLVHKLFSCAYCLSHWVAAFVVLATGLRPVRIVALSPAWNSAWSMALSIMACVGISYAWAVFMVVLMNTFGRLESMETRKLRSLLKEAAERIKQLENEQENHASH